VPPAKRIVHFDRIHTAGVKRQKAALRQIGRIESRPPPWISPSGCPDVPHLLTRPTAPIPVCTTADADRPFRPRITMSQ
jgi:hypothetical protein